MKLNIEDISGRLKSHGVSPSLQRMEIYKYLVDWNNHPTVDMIYQALIKKIPTLSKTTIYNTLKLFIEKELVSEIIIDKNEVRYDADTNIHGHFMCEKTGTIYDIEVDISKINPDFFKKAVVKEHHIYFKGECNDKGFTKKLKLKIK